MELSIKRHRIDSLTTYTMCNELKKKILNTLLIDCNGLLVTTRLGDIIYQYLLSKGIDFNNIVMEDREVGYLIYVRC